MTEPRELPTEPEHGKDKLYRVFFNIAGMAPRHVVAESVEAVRKQLDAEKVDPALIAEIRFIESYYPADYKRVSIYGPAEDDDWSL
jgi:hypothetical protein